MLKEIDQEDIKYKGERHVNFEGRKCCICGKDKTYIKPDNTPDWRTHKNEKGEWDKKSYECKQCYNKNYYNNIQKIDPNSQYNIRKSIANSRTGNLSKFSYTGKSVVSQWIVAKTLGLKDLNIEKNNFNEPIDLCRHSVHGDIGVKYANLLYGEWQFGLGDDNKRCKCNTVILVCMNKSMDGVERVYIIPSTEIDKQTVIIHNDEIEYEKYRVDEKSYNVTYHNVDIPEFFSPFDLWRGKYDKKK